MIPAVQHAINTPLGGLLFTPAVLLLLGVAALEGDIRAMVRRWLAGRPLR